MEDKKRTELLSYISTIQTELIKKYEYQSIRDIEKNIINQHLIEITKFINKEKCITENTLLTINSRLYKLEKIIKDGNIENNIDINSFLPPLVE
jgi:hypothetical protein